MAWPPMTFQSGQSDPCLDLATALPSSQPPEQSAEGESVQEWQKARGSSSSMAVGTGTSGSYEDCLQGGIPHTGKRSFFSQHPSVSLTEAQVQKGNQGFYHKMRVSENQNRSTSQRAPFVQCVRVGGWVDARTRLHMSKKEQPSARAQRARDVYSRAFKSIREGQPDAKEEAQMVLESWKQFERSQDWRCVRVLCVCCVHVLCLFCVLHASVHAVSSGQRVFELFHLCFFKSCKVTAGALAVSARKLLGFVRPSYICWVFKHACVDPSVCHAADLVNACTGTFDLYAPLVLLLGSQASIKAPKRVPC
eukprot:scaffold37472_cov22-Tisochrysis_lutea.AAC.2